MHTRVTIEGLIGCGKTTLLESLRHFRDFEIVLEPVEIYTNFHGYNLLHGLQEPEKRLGCQVVIADALFERISKDTSHKMISERGMNSVKMFVKMYETNYNELEVAILMNHARTLSNAMPKVEKEIVIYLRCDVETALRRIKRRGRAGEENIDTKFLQRLMEIHDTQLLGRPGVFVVDAGKGYDEVRRLVIEILED